MDFGDTISSATSPSTQPRGIGGDANTIWHCDYSADKVYELDAAAVTIPTVTTQAVTSIEKTTATGNGNITATGGEDASTWGVCYNKTGTPTTTDDTAAGSGSGGTGAFTADMTELDQGTLYYVRAYATNSAGTSYGSQVSFTTAETLKFTGTVAVVIAITCALTFGNIESFTGSSD